MESCITSPAGRRSSTRRRSPRSTRATAAFPRARLFHAAGPSADGWTIIAVHESQESWERFRDETLMPTMGAGIDGGFPTPPQETGLPRPQPADC